MKYMAGDRVRVIEPIERYPYGIVKPGNTGTITGFSKAVVRLKLDEPQDGFEDWDNSLEFYPDQDPMACWELIFSTEKIQEER